MKSVVLSGLLAGVIGLSLSSTALGQGSRVALVDISAIFKNNNRFKVTMEAMENDAKAFETLVNQKRETLQAKAEQLKAAQAGTPEYRSFESQLAQETAALQVEIGLKKKEMMEREARVFYEAYAEVVRHTANIAAKYQVSLVLRYDSADIEADDRNSVLRGVNRSIVYQNQLDITRLVLESINARVPASPTNTGPVLPPTASRPRP